MKDTPDIFLLIRETNFKYFNSLKKFLELENKRAQPSETKIFLFNYLERFFYSTSSLDVLLDKYDADAHYKYPIFLILRSSILDVITGIYLLTLLKINPSSFEYNELDSNAEIRKLNNTFLKKIKSTVNKAVDEFKVLERDKGDLILANYKDLFSEYFSQENFDFISNEKSTDSAEMCKQILTPGYLEFKDLYFLYVTFSQFEHCHSHTKSMLYDPNLNLKTIRQALSQIYLGSYYMVKTINPSASLADDIHQYMFELFNEQPT